MTDPTPGLTLAGLVPERFPAARRRIAELWRGRYGQDSPTGEASVNGGIIDVIALSVSMLWEGFEGIFAGSFLRSAVERSLDLWVDGFGFDRLLAQPSRALVTAWGDALATVPTAAVIAVTGTGARFATVESVQLHDGLAGATWVVIVILAGPVFGVPVTDFQVTVDGVPHDVEDLDPVAGVVAESMAAAIRNESAVATAVVAGTLPASQGGHPVIVIRSLTAATITVSAAPDFEVFAAADVLASALESGPVTASAGSLVQLVAPLTGIAGVINAAEALLGRDDETNAELRRRFVLGQGRREKATRRAVRSALLQLAEAAELPYAEARARENTSDVEVDGLPPHSIAPLYYLPGIPFIAIAQAILDVRSNGYQSFGSETAVVLDSGGQAVLIGATPATVGYLHVRISILVVGETWPTDYDPIAAILSSVRAWLVTPGRLEIGVDLYRLDLHSPVLAAVPVGAIKSLKVELATTALVGDAPTFADDDLVVSDVTVLVPADERVSVVPA